MSFETTALGVLAISAFALLVVVTLGVFYLTSIEWRDRRRQEKERRGR